MTDREKLVDLITQKQMYGMAPWKYGMQGIGNNELADHLISNGVTIQSDVIERLSKGMSRLRVRMLGHDKEFNEKAAGYDQSAFCVGFDYAMQLAMGLLTQLPPAPKGE